MSPSQPVPSPETPIPAGRALAPGAVKGRKRDRRRETRTRSGPERANREASSCAGAVGREPAARLPARRAATPPRPELRAAAAASRRCRPSPLGVGSAHGWGPGPAPGGQHRVPVRVPAPPGVGALLTAGSRAHRLGRLPLPRPPPGALGEARPAAGESGPGRALPPIPTSLLRAPRAGRRPGGAGLSPGISAALLTLAGARLPRGGDSQPGLSVGVTARGGDPRASGRLRVTLRLSTLSLPGTHQASPFSRGLTSAGLIHSFIRRPPSGRGAEDTTLVRNRKTLPCRTWRSGGQR